MNIDQVYVFLIRNDVWIYILCGLGLIWYGSEFLRARRFLKQAMFGLERETGKRRQGNAFIFLFILGVIVSAVTYVNIRVAPTLPQTLLRPPTPTRDIFNLPLSSPTPLGISSFRPRGTPTSPLFVPTVTLPSQLQSNNTSNPVGTPTSPLQQPDNIDDIDVDDFVAGSDEGDFTVEDSSEGVPSLPASPNNCHPNATINRPTENESISGSVNLIGTALNENFLFYQIDISGPETNGSWTALFQPVFQTVNNGFLGNRDLVGWENGTYQLRLTVTDANGTDTGVCTVTVQVN